MTRTFGDHSPVSLPSGLYLFLKTLYKERRLHTAEEERYRTKAELGELFALTDKQVVWRLFVPFYPYSLDTPLPPHSNKGGPRSFSKRSSTQQTFADILKDPEDTPENLVANKERAALLERLMEDLPLRQRLALKKFFYGDQNAEDVAKTLPTDKSEPVVRSRVYQLMGKGQRKIRDKIYRGHLFRDLGLIP